MVSIEEFWGYIEFAFAGRLRLLKLDQSLDCHFT